jgi:hypothetical protein
VLFTLAFYVGYRFGNGFFVASSRSSSETSLVGFGNGNLFKHLSKHKIQLRVI